MRYSDDYEYDKVTDEVEELYSYDDNFEYSIQETCEHVEWENYYHNIAQEIVEDWPIISGRNLVGQVSYSFIPFLY